MGSRYYAYLPPSLFAAFSLGRFRLIPKRVHLLEARLLQPPPAPGERLLDMAEPADELVVGGPQRRFGVDLEVAGDIGDYEQQVAELLLDAGLLACSDGGIELGELLLELAHDGREPRPVEADGGRLALQLHGTRQSGEGKGHVGDKTFGLLGLRCSGPGTRPLGLFGGLGPLPKALCDARRAGRVVAEHVGMPPNHLGRD